jgi:hypothetical protein
VKADVGPSQIVRHDEHDVWTLRLLREARRCGTEGKYTTSELKNGSQAHR